MTFGLVYNSYFKESLKTQAGFLYMTANNVINTCTCIA